MKTKESFGKANHKTHGLRKGLALAIFASAIYHGVVFFGAGLMATLAVAFYTARLANKALRTKID